MKSGVKILYKEIRIKNAYYIIVLCN